MNTTAVPGRYTVQVTVTVFADSRRDAYRQVQRALNADVRRHGVEFVDAEDVLIEPFCENLDDDVGRSRVAHPYDDARDLALPGSTKCAACQLERAIMNCINAARREGYTGTNEAYALTALDCDSIVDAIGRKPTREEWTAFGYHLVGDQHIGDAR